MQHEYEITFILRPDLDDADTTAAIERVEATVIDGGGTLLDREDWGKRKLAYLIQKHAKGHYVLLRTVSDPASILEIERRMRLDDRVIRFLSVKVGDDVDLDLRKEQAAEVRAAREAAEAKARAEAEAAAALAAEMGDSDDTSDEASASN